MALTARQLNIVEKLQKAEIDLRRIRNDKVEAERVRSTAQGRCNELDARFSDAEALAKRLHTELGQILLEEAE